MNAVISTVVLVLKKLYGLSLESLNNSNNNNNNNNNNRDFYSAISVGLWSFTIF